MEELGLGHDSMNKELAAQKKSIYEHSKTPKKKPKSQTLLSSSLSDEVYCNHFGRRQVDTWLSILCFSLTTEIRDPQEFKPCAGKRE